MAFSGSNQKTAVGRKLADAMSIRLLITG